MIRALSLTCLSLCACDWLNASNVDSNACAQLAKLGNDPANVAILQTCTQTADCECSGSLCLRMVVPDGGEEQRCNPPDLDGTCPLFYNSSVVHWGVNDDCLDSCNSGGKQCVGVGVGSGSGAYACRTGKCRL